jgi:hypothetical protein
MSRMRCSTPKPIRAECLLEVTCACSVSAANDGVPEVNAEYVRVWDWGLFTFMDYGVDKTNPKWRALRHVDGPEAYTSTPTPQFYENVLGRREPAAKAEKKN